MSGVGWAWDPTGGATEKFTGQGVPVEEPFSDVIEGAKNMIASLPQLAGGDVEERDRDGSPRPIARNNQTGSSEMSGVDRCW